MKLESDIIFKRLWRKWPKKVNQHSAKKALEFLWKTDKTVDWERFEKCVEVYSVLQDSRYYHDFGNWIRNDQWKDLYDSDLDKTLRQERELNELAETIVAKWNEKAHKWWLPVRDEQGRRQLVKEKLQERFFRDNWEQALEWLLILFKHKQSGWLENIKPSLLWFCRGDTVARIVEGEFGFPPKVKKKPNRIKQVGHYEVEVPPSLEDVQELKDLVKRFKTKLKIEDEFSGR